LKDEVRVTVIATGFGPGGHRRRRRAVVAAEAPATQPEERERFDVSDDALEVPSFLRD
jgi:hypothetical protein